MNKTTTNNNGVRANELALFAGIGGGIFASELLGIRTVCAVEIEKFNQGILCNLQDNGTLRPFPIWDDVTTFDGKRWRGYIDIVSGGFPCQNISVAGDETGVVKGKKSSLWKEMFRIIKETEPRFVFWENVQNIRNRGIDTVLSNLSEIGFNAEWTDTRASFFNAPHERGRIFCFCFHHSRGEKKERIKLRDTIQQRLKFIRDGKFENLTEFSNNSEMGFSSSGEKKGFTRGTFPWSKNEAIVSSSSLWELPFERDVRLLYGISKKTMLLKKFREFIPSDRVENVLAEYDGKRASKKDFFINYLSSIGNAQVPICAAHTFYTLLCRSLENTNNNAC